MVIRKIGFSTVTCASGPPSSSSDASSTRTTSSTEVATCINVCFFLKLGGLYFVRRPCGHLINDGIRLSMNLCSCDQCGHLINDGVHSVRRYFLAHRRVGRRASRSKRSEDRQCWRAPNQRTWSEELSHVGNRSMIFERIRSSNWLVIRANHNLMLEISSLRGRNTSSKRLANNCCNSDRKDSTKGVIKD